MIQDGVRNSEDRVSRIDVPLRRADLNKYEAAAGGEFNIGTAQQYGEADIKGKDFHDQVCHC